MSDQKRSVFDRAFSVLVSFLVVLAVLTAMGVAVKFLVKRGSSPKVTPKENVVTTVTNVAATVGGVIQGEPSPRDDSKEVIVFLGKTGYVGLVPNVPVFIQKDRPGYRTVRIEADSMLWYRVETDPPGRRRAKKEPADWFLWVKR